MDVRGGRPMALLHWCISLAGSSRHCSLIAGGCALSYRCRVHCSLRGWNMPGFSVTPLPGGRRWLPWVLRPAKRPGGNEIRASLRRLLRADSHYCCPEVSTGVEPRASISSSAWRRPRRTPAPTGSCGGLRISMPKRSMWRVAQFRYVAPAARQTRRPRRRDEDDDPSSPADVVPRPGYSASRARAYPAPRHLRNGA